MIICGIDPGFNGGISFFNNDVLLSTHIMPIEEKLNGKNKINGVEVSNLLKLNDVDIIYIEFVHAFAGQGRTSIWNFGEGVGIIKGVSECLGIKYIEVSPQKWKKIVLGEKYSHDEKEGAIKFVQDTFPNVDLLKSKRAKNPHDGKADSICIGYYGVLNVKEIHINK